LLHDPAFHNLRLVRPDAELTHLLFFHCYGDPRDLHSFPTRRSSDLGRHHQLAGRCLTVVTQVSGGRGPAGCGGLPVRRRRVGRRSEEHTSELQSPCNLVCRLLLEKKKKLLNTSHRSTPVRPSPHSTY